MLNISGLWGLWQRLDEPMASKLSGFNEARPQNLSSAVIEFSEYIFFWCMDDNDAGMSSKYKFQKNTIKLVLTVSTPSNSIKKFHNLSSKRN